MRGIVLQALRSMKKQWEEGLQVLQWASPAVHGEDHGKAAVPLPLMKVHRDAPTAPGRAPKHVDALKKAVIPRGSHAGAACSCRTAQRGTKETMLRNCSLWEGPWRSLWRTVSCMRGPTLEHRKDS